MRPDAAHDSLEGQRALVIGGYGVGNLGDEAILAGLVAQHDLWDATVVSYDPAQTERLHGLNAVSPFSARFIQAFTRARTVVVGGGGIFSAYMGRFARAIPSVALAARRLGKRVEFRAFGAYPGTPPLTARSLGLAVRQAHVVTVRDASSVDYLRGLGVRRELPVVPDPAWVLEPSSPRRARALLAQAVPAVDGPFVALGVRRVKDPAEQARLEVALGGLGAALVEHGIEPLFVPFSRHPYEPLEDDAGYAAHLVDAIGGGSVLEGEHHPRDVLALLLEARCVVAVRFHALIFALRLDRPLVALPYDAKCSDLLAACGERGLAPAEVTARALAHEVLAAAQGPLPRARDLPPMEAVR